MRTADYAITVYYADASDKDADKLFSEYGPVMEPKRRASIERCSNVKVRKMMICAGALVAKVLGDYGLNSSDIEYGEHGKPFIRNDRDLCFNLSHSGRFLMLAVSNTELGADIQKSVACRENLVKRITTDEERTGQSGEYSEHLNRVWAIKESYTKLIGEGLGIDFATIQYEACDDGYIVRCSNHRSARCKPVLIDRDYEAFISAFGNFSVTATEIDL